ncbi:MAG TPA: EamA family transporter, partial [Paraburkholderia sp.]
MISHRHTILTALLAAALFGITTPLAKALLGSVSPFMLAGLFYLGSGSGLAIVLLLRRVAARRNDASASHNPAHDPVQNPLRIAELPWLAGA